MYDSHPFHLARDPLKHSVGHIMASKIRNTEGFLSLKEQIAQFTEQREDVRKLSKCTEI